MPYKAKDIERRVSKVAGVTQVNNDLQVLPMSLFDDELRYKIARAIYNNPAFWQYASMSNPPIHIIVEKGHVTLTGVVQNNVERMLASRSLALSFNAFSVDSKQWSFPLVCPLEINVATPPRRKLDDVRTYVRVGCLGIDLACALYRGPVSLR